MKDGSMHKTHKAENAVDLDSAALVALTLETVDLGDKTTIRAKLVEASMTVAELVGKLRFEAH
jgi:transposase